MLSSTACLLCDSWRALFKLFRLGQALMSSRSLSGAKDGLRVQFKSGYSDLIGEPWHNLELWQPDPCVTTPFKVPMCHASCHVPGRFQGTMLCAEKWGPTNKTKPAVGAGTVLFGRCDRRFGDPPGV